jgi:acyl carrier protein
MSQIEEAVRQFVVDNFLFGQDDGQLEKDTSFLQAGIVDSTGVLELVGFVEDTYGIRIDDDELIPENLDSINNVSRYVTGKIAGKEIGAGATDSSQD